MLLNTIVYWKIPPEIQDNISSYIGTNLYRSSYENNNYLKLNESPINISVLEYEDKDVPINQKEKFYYLVRFVKQINNEESTYYLAFRHLSPREIRLGNQLRGMLSPFISCTLEDSDIEAGLQYGLRIFNEVPTQTRFTISNLPPSLEPIILTLSAMFAFLQKYAPIAMTDISYNDNGLSLTIDRGTKIKEAIEKMNGFIEKYIFQAKWNYTSMGVGSGTLQLPLSIGGKMSSNLLNVLDIFNIVGR